MANKLFLWNPTIRKYKKLPDFKTKVGDVVYFLYDFEYDEIHDDYKVVSICTNIGRQHDFQENVTRLISSGKFVNGKLHWATSAGLGYERGWSFTSFDLADEKWRKVERPVMEKGMVFSCWEHWEVNFQCFVIIRPLK
ncbi:hypothetical protein H5410_036082 [Solanum commersonii]|uniref:Uncharacterized protein n=1 Tax=Solanum commersonii TaxID=4109 RepID=A0A9J5Y4D6_SOLCO|nr:hypothetical protein H5410_036082 [Solanum commersonii]